jgi:hypothetical protein
MQRPALHSQELGRVQLSTTLNQVETISTIPNQAETSSQPICIMQRLALYRQELGRVQLSATLNQVETISTIPNQAETSS